MKFNSNIEEEGDKKEAFEIIASLIQENSIIFDYGCSNYELFKYIKENYGVNWNKGHAILIGYDKRKDKWDYKNYPSFDIIVCNQVIEHMDLKELELFFTRCNEVLKRDGKIIIGTQNINELYNHIDFWNDPSHIRPYTVESIRMITEQYGFNIIKIIKYGTRINPIKVFWNLIMGFDIYTAFIIVLEKNKRNIRGIKNGTKSTIN